MPAVLRSLYYKISDNRVLCEDQPVIEQKFSTQTPRCQRQFQYTSVTVFPRSFIEFFHFCAYVINTRFFSTLTFNDVNMRVTCVKVSRFSCCYGTKFENKWDIAVGQQINYIIQNVERAMSAGRTITSIKGDHINRRPDGKRNTFLPSTERGGSWPVSFMPEVLVNILVCATISWDDATSSSSSTR